MSSSVGGGPCRACKFFRRRCVAGCIFAPYFDYEQGAAHFAAVHRVFGASNVSKYLHNVSEHERQDAVFSICSDAQARLRNPIYSCVSFQQKVTYPRLDLPLTKSPELINMIETNLKEHYSCPHKQTESSNSPEKIKAMKFQVSMIAIGNWTFAATNPDDIVAKFYFAKKKLLWEFLCPVESETNMPRLKRKIEIQWDDVSSFKESINSRDETGILKIELRKRPTFFIETNPQPGKHTQWKQMDQDFTGYQASLNRFPPTLSSIDHIIFLFVTLKVIQSHTFIYTLHFHPGVLQKILEKLMSHSFWSKLYKVRFPLQQAICFDIDYGSDNNITNNSSRYIPSQTPRFNVNSDLHHHSQGISRVGVGEGNFNMATHFSANDRWQNSYSQANTRNNTANELFGTQAIPPLTQVINEHYSRQKDFTGSPYNNLMIQDEREKMQNTREILSQAYALPETQTNLIMSPHMNVIPMYPDQVGPYLACTLLQEEERQHTEHTHLDGNFQIKDYQKIPYISSNNWSMLPDMDIEDDSNGKDNSNGKIKTI